MISTHPASDCLRESPSVKAGARRPQELRVEWIKVADLDPRFTMANERTFLAWNRTALALIGGGLAIEQFLDTGRTARLLIAIPLILLGAVLAASSYSHWRANQAAMERGEPLPRSQMPTLVALSFALLSLGALILAVVHAL
jgi:putative membrane protein